MVLIKMIIFFFSKDESKMGKVKVKVSVMSDSLQSHGLCSPWNSPGQNTRVGSLSFLQGIFPTRRSKPCLPHCRQILYQLSHKGNPRILEWVGYPFSRNPGPGIKPGSPVLQVDSLPTELSGKPWDMGIRYIIRNVCNSNPR